MDYMVRIFYNSDQHINIFFFQNWIVIISNYVKIIFKNVNTIPEN